MENKLRENYVTSGEAIAANRVMDCIFGLLEQFEYEKRRPNPFTNSPPLPPSCSHLRTWAAVHALRGSFVRLREALDKHREAVDEQVPEGELIKPERVIGPVLHLWINRPSLLLDHQKNHIKDYLKASL